ncbi:MAG: hypothetical protein C0508_27595, partial [Cyanobacteria bacterium PR.023]|nr:hypothetical protein [Cyanobacteria bacterium PR.023]
YRASLEKNHQQKKPPLALWWRRDGKIRKQRRTSKKLRNIETSTIGSIARQAISLKTQLTIEMTTSL